MRKLDITVDNRIRIPADADPAFVKQLRLATTHVNPDYSKKRAMGFWTGDTPGKVSTWRDDGLDFSLPRGASQRLRRIAREFGIALVWSDKRVRAPVEWKPCRVPARDYQETGVGRCVAVEQGIVKAPTGSGKTYMALATLPRIGERALVIVRDRNLLAQWLDRAVDNLGLDPREIGIVQGSKRNIGERLTIALQQTLYAKTFPLQEFASKFGAILVDEVQDSAARTVQETVDAFPARVRLGFSADHSRRDRKEFLIEDLFGDVIYEVGKSDLEQKGAVVPVIVRLVPTDFEAPWYSESDPVERDFTRLVSEMSADEERCKVVRRVVQELVTSGGVPCLVFTHRREYAERLAERELPADGIPTGLLLGSEENAVQFEESKSLLLSGNLKVAVGTFKAVGQGIDIPNVMSGVCATPVGGKQFFGQVRGRICRVVPGKSVGYLYYLWDSKVFPTVASNLWKWNDGLVEVYDEDRGRWVSFRRR